ncbi:MAG: flotillin-like FloA family protein [Bacteroidales bacterium]|jgi:uncharacterized protein YqfA (UPF0365 family)|nr:flotillin-like FloA family protein [Bacteroidales bacterium]
MSIIGILLTIPAGIILLLIIFYFFPIGSYSSAKLAGVEIPLLRLSNMRLKKVPVQDIVNCKIQLYNARIDIELEDLEAHYLANGNIINVTNGLIFAKENNLNITFEKACKADLNGIDLIDLAKENLYE